MNKESMIKLEVLVNDAPNSAGKMNRCIIPVIVQKITYGPDRMPKESWDSLEKLEELHYNWGFIPVNKGEKMNVYLKKSGCDHDYWRTPDAIELLNSNGEVRHNYFA